MKDNDISVSLSTATRLSLWDLSSYQVQQPRLLHHPSRAPHVASRAHPGVAALVESENDVMIHDVSFSANLNLL